jgi:hypothetical protein
MRLDKGFRTKREIELQRYFVILEEIETVFHITAPMYLIVYMSHMFFQPRNSLFRPLKDS